jgi:hypothetical protein
MRTAIFFRVIIILCLTALPFRSHALTISGINYAQYTGSRTLCPSGTKFYIYGGIKYCPYYPVKISWTVPTQRIDGSTLRISELSSYEIFLMGPRTLGVLNVPSGVQTNTSTVVYTPGTYYFSIAAIDTGGRKSRLSNIVKVKIGN